MAFPKDDIFYTGHSALLLNGRFNNLEYGAYAPGTPDVFISDAQFQQFWRGPDRYYIVADSTMVPHLEALVGRERLHQVASRGGKFLFTNSYH